MNKRVVTRFAPSPTGFLHIGGARTALFNWLLARHHGDSGSFLLRIEDTDQERSTKEAVDAILESMTWLGLEWDGDYVLQSTQMERHRAIANHLVQEGHAYHDGDCIRMQIPRDDSGFVSWDDMIMKRCSFKNSQIDDWVILRSNGQPTYNLSVVVDDHNMGVTHVIRGDDHVNNTPKQILLYRALGWDIPFFGHIPLILGEDGDKLSKRHGAIGAHVYREMGYLREAMCNYLVRLGWSHGNDEIFSVEQMIKLFNVKNIGKSSARFSKKKLDSVNGHYIKNLPDEELVARIKNLFQVRFFMSDEFIQKIFILLPVLRPRSKTLLDLWYHIDFLRLSNEDLIQIFAKYKGECLTDRIASLSNVLYNFLALLSSLTEWTRGQIEQKTKIFLEKETCSFGEVAFFLRIALTGKEACPPLFDVLFALGRNETCNRLRMFLEIIIEKEGLNYAE